MFSNVFKKKQEFQADCVYKHCVYKKKVCILSKLKKVSITYNFFLESTNVLKSEHHFT